MSGQPNSAPPSRWAPLTPQTWPQDTLRTPSYSGLGMGMPRVSTANAERARQESFTYSGTWTLPTAFIHDAGEYIQLTLLTDSDGDFWCDQIAMTGWGTLSQPNNTQNGVPIVGRTAISDQRTGRSLTLNQQQNILVHPAPAPYLGVNNWFLGSFSLFPYDATYNAGVQAYPEGFRVTATMAQPFCFTRGGGISMQLYPDVTWTGTTLGQQLVDIALSGWKEYENAS